MTSPTGTATLVRLALRRDRLLLPAWIAVFTLLAVTSADATAGLFPTTASLVRAARGMNATPAMVAVYGHVYDETPPGAVALLKALGTGAVLLAVFAVTLVLRHTRGEEQRGRLELVRAGVVGRHAPLTAALLVTAAVTAALAVLTAVGLTATGLPPAGSIAFALAWTGIALSFAGVAAVTAQLVIGTRAATTGPGLADVAVPGRLGPAGSPVRRRPLVGPPRRGRLHHCRLPPGSPPRPRRGPAARARRSVPRRPRPAGHARPGLAAAHLDRGLRPLRRAGRQHRSPCSASWSPPMASTPPRAADEETPARLDLVLTTPTSRTRWAIALATARRRDIARAPMPTSFGHQCRSRPPGALLRRPPRRPARPRRGRSW
ncbi:hypothetical protein [Saccharothrix syringae]|uniref:ABC transporter permease n=1 Tax=Saccharothrix syringae TaxID=103733 RepID=A0A5Q0H1Y4_SACSY|nr:hypothetical protein [Saccharothrix syringae]QFZ19682.1 hypothetical protein EKG83_21620 [Saccharothrix syringae]